MDQLLKFTFSECQTFSTQPFLTCSYFDNACSELVQLTMPSGMERQHNIANLLYISNLLLVSPKYWVCVALTLGISHLEMLGKMYQCFGMS